MKMKTDEMSAEAINDFAKMLNNGNTAEFIFNDLFYEIFESLDTGYVVNIYCCNKRDEDGSYLNEYLVDGGLCTGSAKDAVEFML